MTMPATQTSAERRALRMRAIFAEARKAGLDTDAVRQLGRQIFGTGLSDASLPELDQVLSHLKRGNAGARGRTGGNEWAFVFSASPDRQRFLRKIYRCAERVGAIMSPPAKVAPPGYVEGIVAQSRGLRPHAQNVAVSLALCDAEQLFLIVQILETYLARHGG